jgi:hypothetical protein
MRFLCLGCHDEQVWNALPASERQALEEESLAYERVLRERGHCLDGIALQSAQSAKTLRFGRGKMLVTDGPFAESKEQLGGFMLLEARDLDHAIELMSKTPCMRVGGLMEIRPVNEALTSLAR